MSQTYTFVTLVDGHERGGNPSNTYEEIASLMECTMCTHALNDCPSENFMGKLYLFDEATMITRTPHGVGVSVAYLNKATS